MGFLKAETNTEFAFVFCSILWDAFINLPFPFCNTRLSPLNNNLLPLHRHNVFLIFNVKAKLYDEGEYDEGLREGIWKYIYRNKNM